MTRRTMPYLLLLVLLLVTGRLDAGGPAPATGPSTCTSHADKTAVPGAVVLGEQVEVTLALRLDCPTEPAPLDIALVLDRSWSMKGQSMADAKEAAERFVDFVNFERSRVGVVSFARTARVDVRLVDDAWRVRAAIARIDADGNTDISGGIREAGRMLEAAPSRPGAVKVMVLLTDGLDSLGPDAVRYQAAEQRGAGTHLVTIALGLRADAVLLREIATTPEDAYVAPRSSDLLAIYEAVATRLVGVHATDVEVRDEIPADMTYVADSATPPAEIIGSTLVWRLPAVPSGGLRLRYRLLPTVQGHRATNVVATARFLDSARRSGHAVFPVPWVRVHAVRPIPTPAVVVPSPAAPPTATAPAPVPTPAGPPPSPVAPPGSTAPLPTRSEKWAYLPLVGPSVCRWDGRPADVVLVLDTSTTMTALTPDGRRKIDAAVSAVRAFAARLDMDDDRVAIVVFNETARTLLPLTADRAAVGPALLSVTIAPGSRIDRGLAEAGRALAAGGRAEAQALVVLLSDGMPSGATQAEVRREAEKLRLRQIALYAVALGEADRAFLRDVAGDPDRFIDAGAGERLDAVYEAIAGRLRCL